MKLLTSASVNYRVCPVNLLLHPYTSQNKLCSVCQTIQSLDQTGSLHMKALSIRTAILQGWQNSRQYCHHPAEDMRSWQSIAGALYRASLVKQRLELAPHMEHIIQLRLNRGTQESRLVSSPYAVCDTADACATSNVYSMRGLLMTSTNSSRARALWAADTAFHDCHGPIKSTLSRVTITSLGECKISI